MLKREGNGHMVTSKIHICEFLVIEWPALLSLIKPNQLSSVDKLIQVIQTHLIYWNGSAGDHWRSPHGNIQNI